MLLRQIALPRIQLQRRNLNNIAPFQSDFKKFFRPIAWLKYKMNVIDKSRDLYQISAQAASTHSAIIKDSGEANREFESWFNATTLHVWMLQKKLISIHGQLNQNRIVNINQRIYREDEARIALELSHELTRHVWMDVEIKLAQAGVTMKISNIIADLVSSFQGQGLAYDEGLYYGDAILAAALWRNLYICNNDISFQKMAESVEYVRKNLQLLDQLDLDAVLHNEFKFLQ